jgi:hypothetical protein
MASFTSEIINYNPYVQQIPESYHQVGMLKQQQYDQGVQAVQNYVSSVAGLEVMKGEHRDYLNSRVGELTTHLNKIAGTTDFSDSAFVNQIGGYATRLSNDPIIQNAVAATATHKKQMQYIEEARKKGEDTTRNEWDYNKQLNEWINDGDIRSSFNGRFSPVVDVMGEFYKAFKEVHPSSSLNQDAFTIGSDGKIVYKDDAVFEQVKKEGIEPSTVQNIANMVFNRADIKNQIRIDGQYSYRGYDQRALAESVRNEYKATIDAANKDIQDLRIKMSTDKSVDKVQLSNIIKQRIESTNKILKDYSQYAGLIASNPEAAKVALYQNKLTSNLMGSFSWLNQERTLQENPMFKAKMDVLKYNLDVSKFEWDKEMDLANLEVEKEKAKAAKKATDSDAVYDSITVDANLPQDLGKLNDATFNEGINADKALLANKSAFWVNKLAVDSQMMPPKIQLEDGRYVWNIGVGGYESQAQAEEAFNKLYLGAKSSYHSGTPSNSVSAFINEIDGAERSLRAKNTMAAKIEADFKNKLKALKSKYNIETQGAGNTYTNKDLLEKSSKLGMETRPNAPQRKAIATVVPSSEYGKELAALQKERIEAYRKAQTVFPARRTTITSSKPETVGALNKTYIGILTALAEGNNSKQAKELLEWTKEGSESTDKTKQNAFGYIYDRFTNKTNLTITRGDEVRSIEVPMSLAEKIPGANFGDPFWNKFGAELSVTNRTTTDAAGLGEFSAHPLPTNPMSKYNIKYHLTGGGDNRYAIQLYVRDAKTGELLVDGQEYNPPGITALMEPADILTKIQELSNDAVIQGFIKHNSK